MVSTVINRGYASNHDVMDRLENGVWSGAEQNANAEGQAKGPMRQTSASGVSLGQCVPVVLSGMGYAISKTQPNLSPMGAAVVSSLLQSGASLTKNLVLGQPLKQAVGSAVAEATTQTIMDAMFPQQHWLSSAATNAVAAMVGVEASRLLAGESHNIIPILEAIGVGFAAGFVGQSLGLSETWANVFSEGVEMTYEILTMDAAEGKVSPE